VGEATKAARACFQAWAAERGGGGPSEARRAIEQVRSFIERFGDSRLEMVGDAAKKEGEPGHRVVLDRVGYREMDTDGVVEYDILPNAWREVVCKGLDPKAAAHAMIEKGYLIEAEGSEKGRVFALNHRLPGSKNSIRLYRVRPSILAGD
jgi:putative DNA primase/helicase